MLRKASSEQLDRAESRGCGRRQLRPHFPWEQGLFPDLALAPRPGGTGSSATPTDLGLVAGGAGEE